MNETMMSETVDLAQELNLALSEVIEKARESLVRIHSNGSGVGAGSIWHPGGLIVTNAHVVGNRPVKVSLPDGSTHPARVLASDTSKDLAALSLEAERLPAIELGDSSNLMPGQLVLALGHPFGITGAVASGVVIGLGADLPGVPNPGREWVAVGLSLRPGHSGGPLVDAGGRLVGINTMMAGPQVGLAVPVHVVKQFLRRELGS